MVFPVRLSQLENEPEEPGKRQNANDGVYYQCDAIVRHGTPISCNGQDTSDVSLDQGNVLQLEYLFRD